MTNVHGDRYQCCTDKLTYIPYFITDEIGVGEERSYMAMDYYVISPAVVYADKVMVQSKQIKEMYVRKLTEFFGEDTKDIWEDKVEERAFPIYAGLSAIEKKFVNMPESWKKIIFKEDGTARRVVVYNTCIGGLFEYKDKMINKIRSSFNVFKENCSEVALIWHPDKLIDATIPTTDSALYKKYVELVEQYKNDGFGIYDDSGEDETILALADAYYGDTDKLVQKCRNRKIPVMIQNVDIIY